VSLNYIYLHGFASGPQSKKARYFNEQLTARGITASIPDLNLPLFLDMTVSRQIAKVESLIDPNRDSVLIGSSMGGLVATLSAIRFPSVKALILLAPGFGIEKRWADLVEPDRRDVWKDRGAIDVFHYATEREESLSYGFVEDLETYSTRNIKVSIPTLIMHGIKDDVVPVRESQNFRDNNRQHTTLIELDDTHELVISLPAIWDASEKFLSEHELLNRN